MATNNEITNGISRRNHTAILNHSLIPKYLRGVHHCFVSPALPLLVPIRTTGVSELCPKQPGWQQGSGEEAI